MIGALELLPFVVLALAGGVHCAGMCGGFAVGSVLAAGPRTDAARWRRSAYFAAFALGKSVTYALLAAALSFFAHGAVTGSLAAAAELGVTEPSSLGATRRVLAWCVGLGLVAIGVLQWLGGSTRMPSSLRRLGLRAQELLRGVRALPGAWSAFGSGMLVGFLPCGLTAGALLLAISLPPLGAALGLFVFGLATAPALSVVAAGARLLPPRLAGPRLARLGSLALIVLGLWTAWRGGAPLALHESGSTPASCCTGPLHIEGVSHPVPAGAPVQDRPQNP